MRRFRTVRARTTLAATLILGIALVVASVSLVVLVRRSLVQNIDEVAEVRAVDIASLVRGDTVPESLGVVGEDGAIAQVVDESGRVVAATAGLEGRRPLASFRPTGDEPTARTVDGLPVGDDGADARVLALDAGDLTIYVASSLEPVDETMGTLRGALLVGAPILLVFAAVTAWFVVGRALRPVEAIREEVADITDRSLDRRVPVPPTGDEVSRLADTMNTMLDRLEAGAERQRRFVADASHELQTPLASTRTDLEVALAHPERGDWQQTAADLLATNRRMERLVRDLLFLARSDDAAPLPPTVPVDLDDVVLEEASRLRQEGRVAVDTSRVSAAAVHGRRDELTRTVRNLLDNACRHASSAVTLELVSQNGAVTLVVADDGTGIAPADRQRVFERFTRVDQARARDDGGTGLGLAIAREIVEGHGGSISIDDSPAGARLVVRLPAG